MSPEPRPTIKFRLYAQAHREGGVAGASAPGPGGPNGANINTLTYLLTYLLT